MAVPGGTVAGVVEGSLLNTKEAMTMARMAPPTMRVAHGEGRGGAGDAPASSIDQSSHRHGLQSLRLPAQAAQLGLQRGDVTRLLFGAALLLPRQTRLFGDPACLFIDDGHERARFIIHAQQ